MAGVVETEGLTKRWGDLVAVNNGLKWEVVIPFAFAAVCGVLAWVAFQHRDLQKA